MVLPWEMLIWSGFYKEWFLMFLLNHAVADILLQLHGLTKTKGVNSIAMGNIDLEWVLITQYIQQVTVLGYQCVSERDQLSADSG